MSGEQIRRLVSPKLFGVNSWIPQMIGQWISDCWSGDRKFSYRKRGHCDAFMVWSGKLDDN